MKEKNHSGLGVCLQSGRLAVLAYADDLLLRAESDHDLQTLIDLTNDFYSSVGLRANSAMSITIGSASHLRIGESTITSHDKLPYLGVRIDTNKRSSLTRQMIEPFIDKLCRSSLRPSQKLLFLRHHLIPKFLHRLIHEDFTGTILSDLDRAFRQGAGHILHLPDSVPRSWFHLLVKSASLGLPELCNEIPILAFKRLTRLRQSDSWILPGGKRRHLFQIVY